MHSIYKFNWKLSKWKRILAKITKYFTVFFFRHFSFSTRVGWTVVAVAHITTVQPTSDTSHFCHIFTGLTLPSVPCIDGYELIFVITSHMSRDGLSDHCHAHNSIPCFYSVGLMINFLGPICLLGSEWANRSHYTEFLKIVFVISRVCCCLLCNKNATPEGCSWNYSQRSC